MQKKSKFKKVKDIIATVVLVLLVIIVVFTFYVRVTGGTPSVFGYQIYRVSSDSMTPVLQISDIILVKKTDPAELTNGDIITYNGTQGQLAGKIITHKIVEEPTIDENGVYHFQTQGIREGATLDPMITQDQLLGKYLCTIPFINYVYNFFLTPYGLLAFILILLITFGSELISLVLILKEKPNDDLNEKVDCETAQSSEQNARKDEDDKQNKV